MSINKKALTRYLAYDRLLRNRGRRYTWKDLVQAANDALAEEGLQGIGKTQFYADLQFMQWCEWKAPIGSEADAADKRIRYFFYEDPAYTITAQPLSETEMVHLRSAVMVLSRFKGMPQFEWVSEIIPAIESRLGLIRTEKEVISFDSNIDYEGLPYITPLFNAIVNRRVLCVTYQDFHSPKSYAVEFHPWYLKQYNNRWFALGHSVQRGGMQNLALDRIHAITETTETYIPSATDWEDFFADVIGVTRHDAPCEEVSLRITDDEQAAYIRTKPLHPSQKPLRKTSDGWETRIRVIPNYELEKLILSFGERVEVLAPASLRQRLRERVEGMAGLYRR